jgi:hypothetical protein
VRSALDQFNELMSRKGKPVFYAFDCGSMVVPWQY